MNGIAIEQGCEVRIAEEQWHGATVPEYKATVSSLDLDEKGPIIVVKTTGQKKEEHLVRPELVTVTRGIIPSDEVAPQEG